MSEAMIAASAELRVSEAVRFGWKADIGSRERTSSRLTLPDVVFRVRRLNFLRRASCLAWLDSLYETPHHSCSAFGFFCEEDARRWI